MALLRPNTSVVDPRFLLYCYLGPAVQKTIEQNTIHGATVNRIPLNRMAAWPIEIPELPEQRAIAEVLGALDDRIAANTRVAATADELVRAEWASLCDDSAEDRSIGQIADLVRSQVDPRTLPGQVPYVGLEHIPRRSMWLGELGSAGTVTSAKSRFLRGDVLFGKLRPYFHKVVGAPDAGICSTDVLVLRARTPEMAGFLLAAVASDEVVAAVTASSEGTRMPRASWKDLATVKVAWPGEDAARSFSTSVDAVRRLVEARARETASLAATRDTLLPALMSGALRVKDAERLAEDLA
jgi:type I restriction enzyme S subunit